MPTRGRTEASGSTTRSTARPDRAVRERPVRRRRPRAARSRLRDRRQHRHVGPQHAGPRRRPPRDSLGAAGPRPIGQPAGPRPATPSGAGPSTSGTSSITWDSGGLRGRAVARRGDRDALRPPLPAPRPLPRRHQLLLGVGPAAVRREPGDARRSIESAHAGHGRRWPSTPWPRIRTSPGGSSLDPSAKAEFYEEYRRLTPSGTPTRCGRCSPWTTSRRSCRGSARRAIPVLLVGGDRDPSLAPMRVMRRKIPGSRLVVLSPATLRQPRPAGGVEPGACPAFLVAGVESEPPRRRRAKRAGPAGGLGSRYSRIQLSASGISGAGAGRPRRSAGGGAARRRRPAGRDAAAACPGDSFAGRRGSRRRRGWPASLRAAPPPRRPSGTPRRRSPPSLPPP